MYDWELAVAAHAALMSQQQDPAAAGQQVPTPSSSVTLEEPSLGLEGKTMKRTLGEGVEVVWEFEVLEQRGGSNQGNIASPSWSPTTAFKPIYQVPRHREGCWAA